MIHRGAGCRKEKPKENAYGQSDDGPRRRMWRGTMVVGVIIIAPNDSRTWGDALCVTITLTDTGAVLDKPRTEFNLRLEKVACVEWKAEQL